MDAALSNRLAALSHPHRMRIFRLLVRRAPDMLPAGEIAKVLSLKASTTSVYLSALTQTGLIIQQRQGTYLRYAVDLNAAHAVISDLFLDCCNGRPDLCPPMPGANADFCTTPEDRKLNVLFVCTGNSARSIMAEAILRHEAGTRFNAFSAGSHPREAVHPYALKILESRVIDTSRLRAKPVTEYQTGDAPKFDFVFTVCDLAANEECAAWNGQPISAHWGLNDPAQSTGTVAEIEEAFRQVFDTLHDRIKAFAALPFTSSTRINLQQSADNIAKMPEKI